ncbi:hypothetical protein ACLB1R_24635 [Escherichia coli]
MQNWIHNRRWMNRLNVTSWQTAVTHLPTSSPCLRRCPVGGFALEWLRNTFRLTDEEIAASLTRGHADYLANRLLVTFPSLFHIFAVRVRPIKIAIPVDYFMGLAIR